jgi:hypothetical protein
MGVVFSTHTIHAYIYESAFLLGLRVGFMFAVLYLERCIPINTCNHRNTESAKLL